MIGLRTEQGIVFAAACLLTLAGAADRAMADEPVRAFQVTDLDGYVELGVRVARERRSREQGSVTVRFDELKFDEILNLNTNGYVYHPRFLDYSVGGAIDLRQGSQEEVSGVGSFKDSGGEVLPSARWQLRFFREHPESLTFFGESVDQEQSRSFERSFDLRSRLVGATFHHRPGPIPLEVSYRKRSRQGEGAGEDVDESGDTFSVIGRYGLGEDSRGRLEYQLTDEDVRGQPIETESFFATNTTGFGAGRRLFSNFRYTERTDQVASQTTSATSSFLWPHTRTLSSRYALDFQRDESNGSNLNVGRASASLTHQLYGSLRSTLETYGRFQDATFGETGWWGGQVTEAYTKRLGAWGRLGLNLNPRLELQQNRPHATVGFVIDESATLVGIAPVELAQLDIDVDTIRVTDLAGAILVEGIDYTITTRVPRTEIRRTVTGNISDGETVLVSYDYDLGGRGDILSTAVVSRLDLTCFQWGGFYATYLTSKQDSVSGEVNARLETRDNYRAGLRLSRSFFRAGVEYEREESDFESFGFATGEVGAGRSFDAFSQSFGVFTPTRKRWRARMDLSHRRVSYTDSEEKFSLITATGLLFVPVARRSYLEISLDYLQERWSGLPDSQTNDVDALGLKAEFTWQFRSLEYTVGGRTSRVERRGQNEDDDRAYLRVRRYF